MFERLRNLAKSLKPKSYEEEMVDFLSQAVSREHLEYLEEEWFKRRPRR